MATQQELDDARRAMHDLMTGKRVASIQKDGRSVTFTSARLSELLNYITNLEEELGIRSRRRPPARFHV